MFLLRDDISDIVRILQEGGIICYPTDTIWGIGCDATNEAAIARLAALQKEPSRRGYILLVSDLDMLKRHVAKIHPRVETLLAYHQRPLTMVYEHPLGLPAVVRASNGSVAIRIATDEFCRALISDFGKPIVSAAACVHGEPFPATFGAISSEILGGVDYVVKYRQDDKEPQQPSSIAYLDKHKELEFIRE